MFTIHCRLHAEHLILHRSINEGVIECFRFEITRRTIVDKYYRTNTPLQRLDIISISVWFSETFNNTVCIVIANLAEASKFKMLFECARNFFWSLYIMSVYL